MRIGFIGLGNMGQGMTANLLTHAKANSHELHVFDINPASMRNAVKNGAVGTDSAGDLARKCDVLFTSLPSSKQVNQIALGSDGILENMSTGGVWFETSTNDLGHWQKLRDAAPDHLTLIDAPVTGGTEGAAAGTLTILLGLDAPLTKDQNTLLESFTDKIVVMGPVGAGYVAKLCQLHLNYLVAQGIGETLMMGAKAGLDLDTLSDVLSHSCAQSYVVDNYIPKILDGSYDPSFTLGLAAKDMRLISDLGALLNVDLPLGDNVYETYRKACDAFGPDAPHLKIAKLMEDKMQQELRSK